MVQSINFIYKNIFLHNNKGNNFIYTTNFLQKTIQTFIW